VDDWKAGRKLPPEGNIFYHGGFMESAGISHGLAGADDGRGISTRPGDHV
jgi:hypothetical protein